METIIIISTFDISISLWFDGSFTYMFMFSKEKFFIIMDAIYLERQES